MARATVNGIGIEYEIIGDKGAPTAVITPGGRFSKDSDGIVPLAEELARGGKRVLIWDRPNCGASDICFDGVNESELQAATLVGLLRTLDLGPAVVTGGSGGARVSLIAAARHPEMVSKLMIWWISGGTAGLLFLGTYYCGESVFAAGRGGMEAVVNLPVWAEQVERNPKNREKFLAMNPKDFIEIMQRWAGTYLPSNASPVPDLSPDDFTKLSMPALILRNGRGDMHHTRETTEWLHKLMPHSRLIDAPWPDNEWNNRLQAANEGGPGMFIGWPAVAPIMLDFING